MKKNKFGICFCLLSSLGCICGLSSCSASVPATKETAGENGEVREVSMLCEKYEYALVYSVLRGEKYYHISNYKEHFHENGIGLELELAVSKRYVYYFEKELRYRLDTKYDSSLGRLEE